MKKIILLSTVIAGFAIVVSAQPPMAGKSVNKMSVEEANRLNGTAQPTINGKPYSQYKAEQDALKKQREVRSVIATPQADVVAINAADAKPAPARPQPELPKRENDGYSKPATVQSAVVDATVKQADQAVAARPATDALLNHFGNGQVIEAPQPAAAEPGSFKSAVANGQVVAPAKAVTPTRSAAEIENAKQQQQQTAKAKVAKDKEVTAASSTVPELKVETSTDTPAPAAPSSKPPVAPPAGKQE